MDTTTANTEKTKDTHPLNSLRAFWRRLTSISVKNQSPVSRFQPDQWCARSSSDMARNCLEVNVGFEDIDSFLCAVEMRCKEVNAPWNGPYGRSKPQDLSATGHLIALDVPRLVELVRELRHNA